MSKLALFAILGSVAAINALAQDDAVKMTRDELVSLLPGTKVTHITKAGSERHWTNKADGSLYATSNNKMYGSALGTQATGQAGTWKVSDEGKYCIDIDWKKVSEKWCAYVLKGDGDLYYLNKVDEKNKIVFAK
jgi:hypothetical protein